MSTIDEVVFNITWGAIGLNIVEQGLVNDTLWYIQTGRVSGAMFRKLKGMNHSQFHKMFHKIGTQIRSTDENINMIKRYLKVE